MRRCFCPCLCSALAVLFSLLPPPAAAAQSPAGRDLRHSHAGAIASATGGVAKTGRYELQSIAPRDAQTDPLSALTEVRLVPEIQTTGEAVATLLQGTGYRLLSNPGWQMRLLLERPLATVHRFLGPISVRRALRTLAGAEWDLIEDPVHRLVAFELLPGWGDLLKAAEVVSSSAAGGAAGGAMNGVAADSERAKLFQVRRGSLRANIERLVALWGWQLVGWDMTLNDGDSGLDWRLHTGWMLAAHSLEEALAQILVPHGLHAVLHDLDGAVSVYRQEL